MVDRNEWEREIVTQKDIGEINLGEFMNEPATGGVTASAGGLSATKIPGGKTFNVSICGQIQAGSEAEAYGILTSHLGAIGKGQPPSPAIPDFIVRVVENAPANPA